MTCLLNCIAGGEDITKVKENPGAKIDLLPLGFEFGTWDFPAYYKFFKHYGKINKDASLHNHCFTKKERQHIKSALEDIVNNWKDLPTAELAQQCKDILKNTDTQNCPDGGNICKDGHNPFTAHTYSYIQAKFNNPLQLNNVEHYQKLLKIFNQEEVEIIAQ